MSLILLSLIVIFIFIVLGALAVFEFLGQSEQIDPVYESDTEQNNMNTNRVRPSTLSGSFFSESKRLLEEELYDHLISAEDHMSENKARMLIVPHAGTQYSGPVAGYAYKTVSQDNYQRVIILGPAHRIAVDGIALSSYAAWRTPLGEALVDQVSTSLVDDQTFFENDAAFINENSIEVQIPFIQMIYPEAAIIPMAVGQLSQEQRDNAVETINSLLDDQTLLLISSDLSHYLTAEEAEAIDANTINLILAGEQEAMSEIDACGREAILIGNLIAQKNNWGASLLEYGHTGQATGDSSRVVGYPAIAYGKGVVPEMIPIEDEEGDEVEPEAEIESDSMVTEEHQEYLLDLARTTIVNYITQGVTYQPEEPEDEFLLKQSGAFVTLEKDEELRGCIGHTMAQEALYLAVRDNAIAAATADPRFEAVTEEELEQIKIEVSILTDPEDVSLMMIEADKDGVILTNNENSATFLPQVWEDFGVVEFMEALSVKTGLDEDVWKEQETTFERYQVIAFSE